MFIQLSGDNLTVTIEVVPDDGSTAASLRVATRYTGVIQLDRRDLLAWGVPLHRRDLAERLKRAIEAGAVFSDAKVVEDIDGNSYLLTTARVTGRRLNADLKRLGF